MGFLLYKIVGVFPGVGQGVRQAAYDDKRVTCHTLVVISNWPVIRECSLIALVLKREFQLDTIGQLPRLDMDIMLNDTGDAQVAQGL